MIATQAALVVKQLFLAGPIVLTEAFPRVGLFTAFVILFLLTTFLFFRLTPERTTNPFAISARLLTSWVLSSSLMIIAAYLKI